MGPVMAASDEGPRLGGRGGAVDKPVVRVGEWAGAGGWGPAIGASDGGRRLGTVMAAGVGHR